LLLNFFGAVLFGVDDLAVHAYGAADMFEVFGLLGELLAEWVGGKGVILVVEEVAFGFFVVVCIHE
jgi:hypothetical protein